jgi:hypothetical protein
MTATAARGGPRFLREPRRTLLLAERPVIITEAE